MKTRIIITLLLTAFWGFLNRGLFYTVDVVAKNTLAVNTVNGGDGALLAQNTYMGAGPVFVIVSTLVLLGIIIGIWSKTISKWFDEDLSSL